MPHLPGGRLPVQTTSVRGRHYDRSEHFRSPESLELDLQPALMVAVELAAALDVFPPC
jgi:hypothetical protein